MSAGHTPGCETCGAPVGWVSGHKLESCSELNLEFNKTIKSLRKTNTELLDAIQSITCATDFVAYGAALHKARAAIAKATGGAT
jgi:hypothetical protein